MRSTIAEAVPRRRTTLRGTILSVTTTDGPWLRTNAVLDDGTAHVVLRFVGRSRVPGLEVGRVLEVRGTPGLVHGALMMINPLYSFDGTG